jgi:hypothetical protein
MELTDVVFAGDSHLREIEGFFSCTSLRRINIPASVEIIMCGAFRDCTELTDVVFTGDSHLREICGFPRCTSLRRINIPASVETIMYGAFRDCTELTDLVFPADSCLRRISGFEGCKSLHRMAIPTSVKVIRQCRFAAEPLCWELIFLRGTRIQEIDSSNGFGAFLVYDEGDIKLNRRRTQMSVLGLVRSTISVGSDQDVDEDFSYFWDFDCES